MNFQSTKTHCPAGHAYDEANTRRVKHGNGRLRVCRACERERIRRKRADPDYRDSERATRRFARVRKHQAIRGVSDTAGAGVIP